MGGKQAQLRGTGRHGAPLLPTGAVCVRSVQPPGQALTMPGAEQRDALRPQDSPGGLSRSSPSLTVETPPRQSRPSVQATRAAPVLPQSHPGRGPSHRKRLFPPLLPATLEGWGRGAS